MQVVIGPVAQEKLFPLRSVPETLQLAAEESFKSLSEEGGSERDLMEVTAGGWARQDSFIRICNSGRIRI